MSLTIFEAMGGQAACLALAQAWHERVMADPVVSHAFHGGVHEHHTERLAAYFAEQLGGPAAYTGGIADYTIPLGNSDAIDLLASAAYRSKVFFDPGNDKPYRHPQFYTVPRGVRV